MKILFVASEATPFSKTGGLADVLGSLPYALTDLGHEVSIILPKHQVTKDHFNDRLTLLGTTTIKVSNRKEYAGFETLIHNGVRVYFIDNEYYFGYRPNLYGDYDDGERYGFFSNAVLALIDSLDKTFDILHLSDWQTGLIPHLIRQSEKAHANMKTVFTIHNIAYQGRFDKELLPYLGIKSSGTIEFEGLINFLKTGIVTADYLTTVSQTYAEELQYAYFGYGMENLLNERRDHFEGILNGIDYGDFNPKTDPAIAVNYGIHNYLKGKTANKQALLDRFQLPKTDGPVLGIVSRLSDQKGFSLLEPFIETLLADKALTLIVLGSGEGHIESFFEHLNGKYADAVGLYLGYSDKIARQIYAGADLFLMPSRYEPCGLSQLISLCYGTIPIVRQTGGLKDTIVPFNRYTGEGNGFGFLNFSSTDLKRSLHEALAVYDDQKVFRRLIRRAMKEDFSWQESAKSYVSLYKKIRGDE